MSFHVKEGDEMKKQSFSLPENKGDYLLVCMKQAPFVTNLPQHLQMEKSATVMRKWIQPSNVLSKVELKEQDRIVKAWNHLQWSMRDHFESDPSKNPLNQ